MTTTVISTTNTCSRVNKIELAYKSYFPPLDMSEWSAVSNKISTGLRTSTHLAPKLVGIGPKWHSVIFPDQFSVHFGSPASTCCPPPPPLVHPPVAVEKTPAVTDGPGV